MELDLNMWYHNTTGNNMKYIVECLIKLQFVISKQTVIELIGESS
jgi:ABC-type oligopeptide transport system ATPase subunit